MRLAAVEGLGGIDDDKAIPSLIKALKADTDPKVKTAICKHWSEPMIKLRFARTNTLDQALAAPEAARSDPAVKPAAEAALAELRK